MNTKKFCDHNRKWSAIHRINLIFNFFCTLWHFCHKYRWHFSNTLLPCVLSKYFFQCFFFLCILAYPCIFIFTQTDMLYTLYRGFFWERQTLVSHFKKIIWNITKYFCESAENNSDMFIIYIYMKIYINMFIKYLHHPTLICPFPSSRRHSVEEINTKMYFFA